MSLFKITDNFLKNCLERMEEFQTDILVFFFTSSAYATVKVTISRQIWETLVYTAYCNTYCNMGQLYCNILQYAFYRIVSPLVASFQKGYKQFLLFPQCFQKTCTADT